MESITPICRLADAIHDCMCHWNHTDGCGYMYDTWENPSHDKRSYLTKAEAMVEYVYRHTESDTPVEEICENIIKILKG